MPCSVGNIMIRVFVCYVIESSQMGANPSKSKQIILQSGWYDCLRIVWKIADIGIDHDTVCAGVVCAATPGTARVEPVVAFGRTGRPHECCAGNGSTNHNSADRMSGQFLVYHENEAIHNDKSRDEYDDEPSCWNFLAGNAIVMTFSVHRYSVRIIDQCDVTIASGSHIDDVTIAKLLTFEILSRAARNERYDFLFI